MSKTKKKMKNRTRAEPQKRSFVGFLNSKEGYDILACPGYTNLAHNPEIISGVDTIARLVGSMTIHLMQNTDRGDIRVKNGLSRKIDIEPSKNTTRSLFIEWIVRTLLLEGNGNAVVYPYVRNGYLEDLRPCPAYMVSFAENGTWDYWVNINGGNYDPDDVLHFRIGSNMYYPWMGEGNKVSLKDVAENLKQAAETEKAFNSSKWKPSVIVKVDALVDEFSDKEGRKKLLEEYIATSEAGEPWMIPAEQFEVEQIKPLSLSDLAIADTVQLNKRTVASILGIPAFVLGVGEFDRDAWNNFVNTRIMQLATMIQQEMTKKLLLDPTLYFRFNVRSLYNYDLKDLAAIADDQYVRGIMSGNEVRDWIGMEPKEGLDELIILENYIPRGMIGDQKKLKGGEE